ncbi:MAG: polysaccharide biosynthesis tyrosine autokinase [Opitutales bacterium TMED207]|nr:sugar tyrosine-protein kinase [Puniceicoccaceae bacterium]RPG15466.1 MAG: polysaccharide biosynthesis tyrosine autokinase [Opitutales bacterium TMED207]
MKNDYTGDQSNMNSNHYGGYSNNYGNPQYYNHGSYRYGGNSGSGSYGYGSYGNVSEEQGPQRTFKDYIFLIRERIWYLIIVFFIIFLGSILYTFNKTKLYTAYATIELLRDDPTVMNSASNLEQNEIRSSEDLNTHISRLESVSIIQGVEKRFQEDELAQFMAPYKGTFSFSGPLTAFEILSINRKIIPRRMSLMVNIAYTHPNPIMAAKIANLFGDEYINTMLSQNIDASMKAVEDLRKRAEQKKNRVEELELKLAEYRELKKAVSLDKQENIAAEQLASLNEIKTMAKMNLDQAEIRWNLTQDYQKQGKELWELPFISEQIRVATLIEQISAIRIAISTKSKRYREKHPEMRSLLQQLQESQSELEYAVQNAVDNISGYFAESRDNFKQASKRLLEKEREMIELSKTRVEFNSLIRDLEVEQMTYQKLTALMAEEKIQVNIKNANARIIDKAFPPREDRPSSPNVFLNLAGGFFGGMIFGLGLVFAVALLDDKVKSVYDIEASLGLPILGIIPKVKKLDSVSKSHIVTSTTNRHVTENFRSMLSYLKINDQTKNSNVFLLTSTVPSEGKSFISSNLALSFASNGEKVLLLDGDLRLPNVAKSLQLENESGVLDYIQGEGTFDSYIAKEVYPNLDILASGGKAKNPTAILNDSKFESMLLQLRDRYDKIIIDSPPLAAVSDSLNIVPLVDAVIYVIKYDSVKKSLANSCIRRLWESKTPLLGAVLNNVSLGLSHYYYSQYSANKKYSAYYMQESYLGNMDESEAEESNQAIVADTFTETKTDSDSEDKLDS